VQSIPFPPSKSMTMASPFLPHDSPIVMQVFRDGAICDRIATVLKRNAPVKTTLTVAASIILAAMTVPTLAGEAQVVDGGARVRAGPGIGYRTIASIPGGRTVNVGRCTGNGQWCRVTIRGGRGWVAFSRLAFPYVGRPGEENYGTGTGTGTGADGEPVRDYVKILGIVVDKPGYCYALSKAGQSIIVKCP
jgi:uncharacterized protein YraI